MFVELDLFDTLADVLDDVVLPAEGVTASVCRLVVPCLVLQLEVATQVALVVVLRRNYLVYKGKLNRVVSVSSTREVLGTELVPLWGSFGD